MKFLLTLRMEDGSKKEVEKTGKTLSEIFSDALKIENAKEIIRSERVGEVGEYVFVCQDKDEQELYSYSDKRRWVKAKVPIASDEDRHGPLYWHVEIDEDGKRLPGYWAYYPQDDKWGTVVCHVG